MKIRAFDLRDAAACCVVINAGVETMSGLNGSARLLIASKNVPTRLGAELARAHTVVAQEGDVIIGVGAIDGAEIKRLYVLPSQHKRGIGSAILFELEAHARQCGLQQVFLRASPSSEGFYASHAYHRIREEMTVSADAEFVHVLMEKAWEP
jgi:GNAT superfamily N-acetyltransferase